MLSPSCCVREPASPGDQPCPVQGDPQHPRRSAPAGPCPETSTLRGKADAKKRGLPSPGALSRSSPALPYWGHCVGSDDQGRVALSSSACLRAPACPLLPSQALSRRPPPRPAWAAGASALPVLALDATSCRPRPAHPSALAEPPWAPLRQGCTGVYPGCGWAWHGAQSSPGQVNRREAGVDTCKLGLQPRVCVFTTNSSSFWLVLFPSRSPCGGPQGSESGPPFTGPLLLRGCSEKVFWALLFPGLEAPS